MEKNNTYKLYKIELETGKVSEAYEEFEFASDAQSRCDFLNETQILGENIKYIFYYNIYNCFSPFKSQEQLKAEANNAINAYNRHVNRLKALCMVAKKSLLQSGLKEEEAV